MLRPSHPLATRLSSSLFPYRLAAVGLALAVQLVVFWTLTSGLAVKIGEAFHPFQYVPVAEPVKPVAPPPIPHIRDVAPPQVAPPLVTFDPNPDPVTVITVEQQLPIPPAKPPLPPRGGAVPDHDAVAIAATQTTPPYPAVAQRLGAEGKVILRLSVLADGRVGAAEIVTSSGRHDLDETAQQWIVAHWTYRPALRNGAPAASQVLAAVHFSLKDAP
jgi:protein TonB